jgi:hypothetical protein
MDTILQLIKNYLDERDSDYSIMLTGNWGSGKTYFVRNVVKPFVEEIEILKGSGKLEKYQLLYLSAKGVESLDALRNRIVLGTQLTSSGWLEKTLPVAKGLLSKIPYGGNIDPQAIVKAFFKLKENHFLVVDDLERVNGIEPTKVMMFLSDYFEVGGNKVMFIANKERLNLDQQTQEKYVRYTFSYEPDIDTTVSVLVDKYAKDNVKAVFQDYVHRISKAFTKPENRNFRTLKYFIFSVNKMLDVLEPYVFRNQELKKSCIHCAFDCLFLISIESKHKDFKKYKNDLIYVLKGVDHPSVLWFYWASSFGNDAEREFSESEAYQKDIYANYIQPGHFKPYYDDIFIDYIEKGVWDRARLCSYFDILQDKMDTENQPESIQTKNLLMQPILLDDEILVTKSNEALQFILNGEYLLGDMFELLSTLCNIKFNLGAEINFDECILDQIIDIGLTKVDGIKLDLRTHYQMHADQHFFIKRFYDAVVAEQIRLKSQQKIDSLRELFGMINNSQIANFVERMEDIARFNDVLFSADIVSPQQLFTQYNELNNASRQLFNQWFYEAYMQNGMNVQFRHYRMQEVDFLNELHQILSNDTQELGAVSRFHSSRLERLLISALKQITS